MKGFMPVSNFKSCLVLPGEECRTGYLQVHYWTQDSIYSMLSRFAMINSLSSVGLENLFRSKAGTLEGKRFVAGLETLAVVDIKSATVLLGLGREFLLRLFLRALPINRGIAVSPYLRYCPICIGGQRHFVFFQRESLIGCPFHGVPLLNRCRACGLLLIYAWSGKLFAYPFACPGCSMPLAGVQSRRCFYDLLTARRESLLEFYSPTSAEGQYRELPQQSGCPGFLVTLPNIDLQVYPQIDSLPLRELRENEVDWQMSEGYIQIRTKLSACRREEGRSFQSKDLVPCLKAIFRHIRKIWQVRDLLPEQNFAASRDFVDSRWRAYKYFHEYWTDILKSHRSVRSIWRLQTHWRCPLDQQLELAEIAHWPKASRAWFIHHTFADCVLGSLSRCIEASSWSPDVGIDLVMDFIGDFARPLWPIEFINEQGRASYRLLRYRRFWSEMLYSKSNFF